jgi:hypothetical protein
MAKDITLNIVKNMAGIQDIMNRESITMDLLDTMTMDLVIMKDTIDTTILVTHKTQDTKHTTILSTISYMKLMVICTLAIQA